MALALQFDRRRLRLSFDSFRLEFLDHVKHHAPVVLSGHLVLLVLAILDIDRCQDLLVVRGLILACEFSAR